jgi:hypothetical protein
VSTSLRVIARVNILQFEVLHHGIGWWLWLLSAGWQNLFQKVEVLKLVLLGELDIKLNVKVAEVVVAEGRHTLTLDHLDSA